MISRTLAIEFIFTSFISLITSKEKYHGPKGLEENEATNCEDFSRYARFNPYSVLDSEWMVFYYWGPPQSASFYWFIIPSEKEVSYFKELLDYHTKEAINWTSKTVLMRDRSKAVSLLVERTDRGQYDLYVPYRGLQKDDIMDPLDVRFKQTGDNRYLAFMICKTHEVYVMARVKDIPPKKQIQDAAARIGHRGRGGKSYLYQGHQWMPIPEASEHLYWNPSRMKKWYLYE